MKLAQPDNRPLELRKIASDFTKRVEFLRRKLIARTTKLRNQNRFSDAKIHLANGEKRILKLRLRFMTWQESQRYQRAS